MWTTYELYLSRRLAPTSVKLRMFWVNKFRAYCDPLSATEDHVYGFLNTNPDWSPETVQTILASLRTFYGWAESKDLAPNIMVDVKRVKVHRRNSRIAPEGVLEEAIRNATPEDEAMIRLAAECGLRVAEIAGLKRTDRNGSWLEVEGKGGEIRSVYLNPELDTLLTHIENTSMRWGYYFPGRYKGSAAPSTIWKHVRALTGYNTHSLRHRAGTTVYRRTGHDLRLAQEFLGHSSPTTTAIYVHVEREQLIRAAEATRMSAA